MSESEQDNMQLAVLDGIAAAEINQQIATAKRFPRTLSKVKQDMLSFATLDEETASACFYTLPRGGKAIQGPSVRLAEIAVACYSNLRAGSRILQTVTDGPTPHVVVQAVAHDLEKNTAITIEKRRRITKKKSKDTIDEDDINLACNACSAIAFRDAVFKVVPQALIRPVFEAAKKVAVGEAKSLVETRTKVFDRLKQMGVTEDRILAVVECRKLDDVTLEKLEILIGLGTAIRDGDTTIEESFPRVQDKPNLTGTPASSAQPEKAPEKPATETAKPAEKTKQQKMVETLHKPVKRPEEKAPVETAPPAMTEPVAAPATEPAPQATEPNATTEEQATANPPAEPTAFTIEFRNHIINELTIPEDDFLGWLDTTGLHRGAKVMNSILEVPEEVLVKLSKEPARLSRCRTIFGTTQAPPVQS